MSRKLTAAQLDELKVKMNKHLNSPDSLIPCIHEAQDLFGGVPKEAQEVIAEANNCSIAKVGGIISFYDYFTSELHGENVIEVCVGTSCYVQNSESLLDKACELTNCKPNGTSPDGKYSIIIGRCLGMCEKAPNMIVNHKVYNHLTMDKMIEVIKELDK